MKADIKDRLLDEAQFLVQTRGFMGFSYQDLSKSVGITTASIHYHFPSKTDLGVALVRRYREALNHSDADIAASPATLHVKLEKFATIYRQTLEKGRRVCVCSALAGEFHSLPEPMQRELTQMIEDGVRGIERILRAGQESGEFSKDRDPKVIARLWYCALQGSLSLARASEKTLMTDTLDALLASTI